MTESMRAMAANADGGRSLPVVSNLLHRRRRISGSGARGLLITLCLLSVAVPYPIAQEPSSPEYSDAVEKGRLLVQQGKTKAAIVEYQKANDLANGRSVHCLLALAILHNSTSSFEKAADYAQRAAGLAEAPGSLHRAYKELGVALHSNLIRKKIRRTDRATSAKLEEAEAAFRKALELSPDDGSIYFPLANVLADQMVRWERRDLHDEIKALSREHLKRDPQGPNADWARKASCWIEGPETEQAPLGSTGSTATAGQTGEAAVHVEDDVIKPEKISAPQPQYGDWARRSRIQGAVIVQAIIDKQGDVRNVKVLQGLPLCLTEEAIKAIRRWQFEPATLNGRPVDVYYNLTVNFRLE